MAQTAPSPDAGRMRGGRRALVWTLVVLASLITLGSTLNSWVEREMLDNQSWEDASAELIEDPEVQSALSVFLVNELYDNVDVASALEQRLPPDLKRLAAPVAAGARKPVTDGVQRLLEAPRVQQLFINASAEAHQKAVNVLEDKTGHGISTGDGVVTLDLGELVTEIGTQLGVSDSALAKIPPDTGMITVMSSDRLSAAQTAVKTARVLSAVLLVLVLALYALAIYLARGERRETLRNIGFAFVLIGLIVLVVRRVTGNEVIDALTTPQGEAGGRQAWLIASELLSQLGWAEVLYGAIVVAATIFAGPTAAATSVRGRVAPVLNERPVIAWAAVGAVFLLLVLWGGTLAGEAGLILDGWLGRELGEDPADGVRDDRRSADPERHLPGDERELAPQLGRLRHRCGAVDNRDRHDRLLRGLGCVRRRGVARHA